MKPWCWTRFPNVQRRDCTAVSLLLIVFTLLWMAKPSMSSPPPRTIGREVSSTEENLSSTDQTKFLSLTQTKTIFISIGQGRRKLWVYFNPDCSYCHRLWLSLDGVPNLVVYWIPVSFSLKSGSLARSAAILSSKNPAQALEENELGFDDFRERGGFPIPSHLPESAMEAVTSNTMFLRLWTGQIATPTLLYKDGAGKSHVIVGLPDDIPSVLRMIRPGGG